jgi:predicted Rdx family selenoprotein
MPSRKVSGHPLHAMLGCCAPPGWPGTVVDLTDDLSRVSLNRHWRWFRITCDGVRYGDRKVDGFEAALKQRLVKRRTKTHKDNADNFRRRVLSIND